LEFVTESAKVAAFQAPLFALAFAGFDQVLEAAGTFHRGFTALSAAPIALHAKLIFSLP
jgi:hypothetical protein